MHGACGLAVGEHVAAQVEAGHGTTQSAFAVARLAQGAIGFAEFEQVVDGRDQLAVVPGFRQVIRCSGLDQVDGSFEMRPRRQQDHRQVRVARAEVAEQRLTLAARGGVGAEVHVLDHQVDRRAREHRQAFFRRGGAQRVDVVQREQQRERIDHARVVVDQENGRHARMITRCAWPWPARSARRGGQGQTWRPGRPATASPCRSRDRSEADATAAGFPQPAD